MILYSATHSGHFFYRVQVLIIDCSRKLEQLLRDLHLTLQTLETNELTSLYLCVVLEKGLTPSGSASVSQSETSQMAYLTPLFSTLPLWKSWLWPVFLFMLRMLSSSVRWVSAQLLGSLFWTTRRGTPPLSPESSVNCCGLSRRTLRACGRYDSLLRV